MIATERLDYALPQELIAQAPAARRDGSRLLVVDRASRSVSHRSFSDLPAYLRPGDVLFRNNASVLPARLAGKRPTGGSVECFLLRKTDGPAAGAEEWECLVRPGRKLSVGSAFEVAEGELQGVVAAVSVGGTVLVRFTSKTGTSVAQAANRSGDVPLPPYIRRDDSSRRQEDRERYQTVYADPGRQVAVAAPTAGLHFTQEVLERARAKGCRTADLTLHVGLGTFRPISTEKVESHPIHSEVYEIPRQTQEELFRPGVRRISVGTTTVRSVEDFLGKHSSPTPAAHLAEASIFIYPPYA
ncbi:MAG TPA: S-adenosylmethionine:tRNA ribosyltransferase-isomerase, partial [Opitutaceae bacterium]